MCFISGIFKRKEGRQRGGSGVDRRTHAMYVREAGLALGLREELRTLRGYLGIVKWTGYREMQMLKFRRKDQVSGGFADIMDACLEDSQVCRVGPVLRNTWRAERWMLLAQ